MRKADQTLHSGCVHERVIQFESVYSFLSANRCDGILPAHQSKVGPRGRALVNALVAYVLWVVEHVVSAAIAWEYGDQLRFRMVARAPSVHAGSRHWHHAESIFSWVL